MYYLKIIKCPAFEKCVKSGNCMRNFFDAGNVKECTEFFTQTRLWNISICSVSSDLEKLELSFNFITKP